MTQYFQDAHAHEADRTVSLLAQDQYAREVLWIPIADGEEKALLLERVTRGCFERKQAIPNQWRLSLAAHARERLVESYQPLILGIAASFTRSSTSYAIPDFASEGTIGLLMLLDRLDSYERLNVAVFHTLAVAYIEGSMLDALKNRDAMVRVSDYTQGMLKQLERVMRGWIEAHGCEPLPDDIAQVMHLSVAKVRELLVYRSQRRVASLEGLLDEVDAEALDVVSLFASEVPSDETRPTPLGEAIEAALATTLKARYREGEVVRLRYGLDEGPCKMRSHLEVASLLGMALSTVESCDQRAKKKLRQALAGYIGNAALSSGVPSHVA